MYIRTTACILVVCLALVLVKVSNFVDAEGSESNETETDTNTTILQCYLCDATEVCALDQNDNNGTDTECAAGQHCWIWKTDDTFNVTYKRDCGDPCDDDSRELDCKTSNNLTECTLCCSDSLCNVGLLNGVTSHTFDCSLWIYFFTTFVAILASNYN